MASMIAVWVSVAISAVLFFGAAAVFLRGSRDKGTIATLDANNKALTERVAILEKKDADNLVERATDRARIGALERENASLLSQRPSADLLADIQARLVTHDTETRSLLDAIVVGIQKESGSTP